MDANRVGITPDGELGSKVGRNFDLEEAARRARDRRRHSGKESRRGIFALPGTHAIDTAGPGFMLMVKERCRLPREDAVIVHDRSAIGRMRVLARFEAHFLPVHHGRDGRNHSAEGDDRQRAMSGMRVRGE